MCLDCGCELPDESHGDERHILMKELVAAARANGGSVEDALRNIESTARKVLDGELTTAVEIPDAG